MIVHVNWKETDFHFEAENETEGKIRIDGNTSIGGFEGGMSPMQLLLAGIGGCSAIDILSILEKKKQSVEGLTVRVDGDKQSVGTFSEFKTIHMHYTFTGSVDIEKAKKAVELSINKYCSVSKALEKTSELSWELEVLPAS
ncbi:MAG: OsmC family protein [Bacteroidota bacterium]